MQNTSLTGNFIPYEPRLRKMPFVKSATAAILLRQLDFLWGIKGGELLYQFLRPCKHKLYKDGDSWEERLGFSEAEFRTAFDQIGVRHKSKGEFEKQENPFMSKEGEKYWCSYTDRIEKITYYIRNHEVLDRELDNLNSGNWRSSIPRNEDAQDVEIESLNSGKCRSSIPNLYTDITPDITPDINSDTRSDAHSEKAREKKNKNFSERSKTEGYEETSKTEGHKKKSKTGGRLTAISSVLDNGDGSDEGNYSDFSLSREFSQFKADLIEYAKATGKRSPNGWVNTILKEVKELKDDSPFYQEWLADEPLGSHLMNPWDVAPHKPDPKFKQYLKNELAEPHDSEAKKVERMNYVLYNPDRAQEHWESYQRKIESQKQEEEKKAQEEIDKLDEIFPEDAPYQFVEMMVNQEGFSKSFNAPKVAGSGFLRSGILKAYSHADPKEKDAIAQLLLNNEVTKKWASETLDYDKIVSNG